MISSPLALRETKKAVGLLLPVSIVPHPLCIVRTLLEFQVTIVFCGSLNIFAARNWRTVGLFPMRSVEWTPTNETAAGCHPQASSKTCATFFIAKTCARTTRVPPFSMRSPAPMSTLPSPPSRWGSSLSLSQCQHFSRRTGNSGSPLKLLSWAHGGFQFYTFASRKFGVHEQDDILGSISVVAHLRNSSNWFLANRGRIILHPKSPVTINATRCTCAS